MTFETLNNNVMLVELSGKEMEKFHITYEMLNDNSEKTQIALKFHLPMLFYANEYCYLYCQHIHTISGLYIHHLYKYILL